MSVPTTLAAPYLLIGCLGFLNFMSLMLHKLNNIRSLRTLSREFSIDVLKEVLEKFRVVTEEKRTRQQLAMQQQAEHQEKANTWLELMRANGISPDDLVADTQSSMAVGKEWQPHPAKYRYTDHTGTEETWTGQGRMPKPIAQTAVQGRSLDGFLI